jgi:hypothetical protein
MKYDHLFFIIQSIELIYQAAQMDKVRFKQLVFKDTKIHLFANVKIGVYQLFITK